jgi:hypothetical protein
MVKKAEKTVFGLYFGVVLLRGTEQQKPQTPAG